jgi:medium-chain acyl-[acyl-carrier-protein] hydrolase
MGALLSFELVRQLRRAYNLFPVCLFVSGRGAPQLPEPDRPIHALPDAGFVKEIRRLNGTREKVLAHAELMQLLLPVLRADFALCETYTYSPEAPLDCPISAFGGLADPRVNRERLQAWCDQTRAAFSLSMLPGDHFFLHTASSLLLQTLSRECHQVICKEEQQW